MDNADFAEDLLGWMFERYVRAIHACSNSRQQSFPLST